MAANRKRLWSMAHTEVQVTLDSLPGPLRERARRIPVTFEMFPGAGLESDGVEPDVLGLFVGPEMAEEGHVPMPPQIILFLGNLWDEAEGDSAAFREEVRTTLLHELGHYLGYDEEQLAERGFE